MVGELWVRRLSGSRPHRTHTSSLLRKLLNKRAHFCGVVANAAPFFCHSLHAADKHGECVSCLSAAQAHRDHCGDKSLSSLRSRLAFFSDRNPAPRVLPLFSSQGPERKKQWGKGSQRPEMSDLMPAVPPHTSLSPHRELYLVLFIRLDQHSSTAASDLVSFGGSDDGELDDSLSLAASDTKELQCAKVMSLLVKEAVEMVSLAQSESGFYSRYFLVLKKDGRTSELWPYETAV